MLIGRMFIQLPNCFRLAAKVFEGINFIQHNYLNKNYLLSLEAYKDRRVWRLSLIQRY